MKLILPICKNGNNYNESIRSRCCCCSVAKSCPILYDCMDCRMPGFPVLHHLLEFAQTHAHKSVMPSHPVAPFSSCSQSFPASGSFPMNQLFTSVGQSIRAYLN